MILDESVLKSELFQDLVMSSSFPRGVFVEIGSGRNSTALLCDLAARRGERFLTVDLSALVTKTASAELRSKPFASAICTTGQQFLRGFEGDIAFSYLDNYDWVDSKEDETGTYPAFLSKRESELVHLEQAMIIVDKVPRGGLVLFDDTWFLERDPPGQGRVSNQLDFGSLSNAQVLRGFHVFGKGSLAVPFLLVNGFSLRAVSERPNWTQVLLERTGLDHEGPPYDARYFYDLLAEHRMVRYRGGNVLARWRPTRAWLRRTAVRAIVAMPDPARVAVLKAYNLFRRGEGR